MSSKFFSNKSLQSTVQNAVALRPATELWRWALNAMEDNSDYEGYEKSLEAVREGLLQDYWAGLLTINRHQIIVARTYLWVSAALIGAYATAVNRYYSLLTQNLLVVFACASAFVLAAIAFGLCLYSMPARGGYRTIPDKGWGEFSHEAYDLLEANTPNLYAVFLSKNIRKIDIAYEHNFYTNKSRAKLLRVTSWFLIASFTVAAFSGSWIAAEKLYDEEIELMAPENEHDTQKNTSHEDEAPKPNVPKPPPPADIGGGKISTHSEDRRSGTTFSTESVDEDSSDMNSKE